MQTNKTELKYKTSKGKGNYQYYTCKHFKARKTKHVKPFSKSTLTVFSVLIAVHLDFPNVESSVLRAGQLKYFMKKKERNLTDQKFWKIPHVNWKIS